MACRTLEFLTSSFSITSSNDEHNAFVKKTTAFRQNTSAYPHVCGARSNVALVAEEIKGSSPRV